MKNNGNGDDKNIDMKTIYNELDTLFNTFTHCPNTDEKVHTLNCICKKLYEGLKAQSQISYRGFAHNKNRIEKIEKRLNSRSAA